MTNANDLAFNDMVTQVKSIKDGVAAFSNPTLTKREYFAAMAMQGIIAAHVIYETGIDNELNAQAAVKAADELIKALNEQPCSTT